MADEEKKETAKKTAPKKAAAPRRTARTTKAKAAEVKAEEAKTTAADEKITETKHIEAEKPAIHKEEKIMTQEALGMVETRGLTAAIEAADIVLMDDDPLKISKAIHISRKCIHIVYENIYFAIGIKVLFLLLGAIGIANMWMAIFADVGVMILAVLNAIRALFVKNL